MPAGLHVREAQRPQGSGIRQEAQRVLRGPVASRHLAAVVQQRADVPVVVALLAFYQRLPRILVTMIDALSRTSAHAHAEELGFRDFTSLFLVKENRRQLGNSACCISCIKVTLISRGLEPGSPHLGARHLE